MWLVFQTALNEPLPATVAVTVGAHRQSVS